MNEKQLNIVNFKALSLHRSVHAENKGRFGDLFINMYIYKDFCGANDVYTSRDYKIYICCKATFQKAPAKR